MYCVCFFFILFCEFCSSFFYFFDWNEFDLEEDFFLKYGDIKVVE